MADENPIYESTPKLFGRQRPVHAVLGGGTVADVLLWRKPKVSTVILFKMTLIWFLFAVVEYNVVNLMCHILITTMLLFFIWCTLAELFQWSYPQIPEMVVPEPEMREAVAAINSRLNLFLSKIVEIACGKDLASFFLTLVCLWMLSALGNHISSTNLFFLGYLCLQLIPFLYEKFEEDVDHAASIMYRKSRRLYDEFSSRIMSKIPRGPTRDKKVR